MSEQLREQLSALMDGELDPDGARFLLRRIAADADLKRRWERQHLARAALRRQTALPLPADFAERVMAQVQSAPAPAMAGRWRGALRLVAGGAIAASVATAALMLAQPGPAPAPALERAASTAAPAMPVAPRLPAGSDTLLQSRPMLGAQPASATLGGDAAFGVDPRLQSYLIRHYEAAGASGRGGMVPYVLLVVPAGQGGAAEGREAAVPRR